MIVTDSYLAMVLPDDIAERIAGFIAGKQSFPFIGPDELVCIMYLYGRNNGVGNEIDEVASLAQRTASQTAMDIESYAHSSAGKLDPEYIRSKYLNRELQLAIEKKLDAGQGRVASDPAILSDCFAQHLACHKQDYFFELYGPFKDNELTSDIRPMLSGRMVMVGYNRKNAQQLESHPLIPVYIWFKERVKYPA